MTVSGQGMTMSDLVARFARTTPDAVAFRDGDLTLTWTQTHARVSRMASVLAGHGVGPGDRVAVLALNSVPLIEAMAAVLRLGAICVPVNFRLVAEEVTYVLTDSGARVVVADDAFAPLAGAAGAGTVVTIGAGHEDLLAGGSEDYTELPVDDAAPALVMYTSGTTGRPKGAVLSHRNMYLHAYANALQAGSGVGDNVGMSGAPLFHIAGVSGFYNTLIAGGTTVLTPSGGFDPSAMLDLLERERVSTVFFVPAQWAAIVAVPGVRDRDLSALRRAVWGAAPASTTLLRTMIDTFPGAEVMTAFGQTECSPVTCMLGGEDSIRKIGSIGKPIVGVEVRIVDDEMVDVAPGEVGEIVYRGPTVMAGYWNKPEETAEAFRGGWFHSGDLVRADPDGYLYVVDRKKDMIISGGENIYCAEVENALAAHPKVAEVAIIGVPDERYGEAPLAVIAPRDPADPPTADDIEAFSREHLAAYKRPRRIVLVDALPRNPSGKVLKTALRTAHGAASVAEPAV
ncbi:fatty-acid--CoA ligase FadD5 [Pseudonocardia petroleophila]|uniref:Long-chain-fatty-acid--CoA ligase n=1 Tax=Pseudonocardia petroleophila TaxID=37331 RepID=A0A7G7MDH3_9PSEU|nr:long-chain-fatty-acid--CoA ligase [Pseudonocardia petroleophila]QNG50834.1 long-chain-fatty-acid--CoA ligase [Pseudonocardia petroleophila]